MSILGRWTQGTTTLVPGTSFTAPNGLFGTQARNDGSAYTFTNSTATLTLPSASLADGYLIIVRVVFDDTSSGRVSITGRVQQTGGTGNFVNFQTGGYSRDALNDKCYHSCGGFVDNPSASATFQYSWERESDPPTGGTLKSSFDVIPFFYSDIAMYDGSNLGAYNGTTPNVVTIANTVLEGTAITRTGNVVTVTGDNKRYFIMASQWWQNRGSVRTQRIAGLDIDGAQVLECQGVSMHKQASADGVGCHVHHIMETVTASRTIEITSYRGDGVANGDGGADADGQTPTQGQQGLVVIELNDATEVFQTSDATGLQELDSATPLDINAVRTTDFIDAGSWAKVGTVGMENNKGATFDALTGANVWAASSNVNLDQRALYESNITVDGVEDADVFHGSYMRGEQSTFDQFGLAFNPIGFVSLDDNEDLGVSTTQIGQTNVPDTQAGTVGMWGINLDTMDQVNKDAVDTLDLEIDEGAADLLGLIDRVEDLDLAIEEGPADLQGFMERQEDLDLAISEEVDLEARAEVVDDLDLAIEEQAAEILAGLTAQDILDLAIVEAAELLSLAEVLDALDLAILEGVGEVAVMVPAEDTLGLTVVEETADLLGLIQPVDTTGLTLAEVVQIFTTAARLDTLGISISEVADLLGLMSRADLLDLEIVEGPAQIAVGVAAEDTLDLDITEGPSQVLVAIAREDTLDLSLVEQVDLLGFIQRSDAVALTIVEGVPLLLVPVAAADLLDLEIVEGAGQIVVGVSAVDVLDLEVVEAVAKLTVAIQASDLLDLSVSEVAQVVGFLNRTDILNLSLAQAAEAIVFIQAADALGIEILDAAELLSVAQAADDLDLDLVEVASVLSALSAVDTLGIDLTEDPGDVLAIIPFQGILVQPFTLVVVREVQFTLQIEGSGEQIP